MSKCILGNAWEGKVGGAEIYSEVLNAGRNVHMGKRKRKAEGRSKPEGKSDTTPICMQYVYWSTMLYTVLNLTKPARISF